MSLTVMLMSCDYFANDDDYNNSIFANLPTPVFDYIEANYPDYDIQDYETEDLCDDVEVYEVELEDGPGPDVDLYFSLDGDFLFAATDITAADLPTAVMNTIETEFPGYEPEAGEIEQFDFPDGSIQYEVELYSLTSGSGPEILFNADGSIACYDDDDDDDGEDDPDSTDTTGTGGTLPPAVLDFIQQEFDGYNIESVETEDICDDVLVYEVELEDGPGPDVDLYFDMDWNFLFTATEISADDLPAAVTSFLAMEFPGYEIEEDDVERWELADGGVRYELELESDDDDDDDIEIVVNEDGSLYCLDD
jgi:uncharacterized membrane protein YkoI